MQYHGMIENNKKIKKSFFRQAFISMLLFLALMFAFVYGIGRTQTVSVDEEKDVLLQAIEQGALQCYVLEGRYPESIEYLEENYGIVYDKESFRVDYKAFGSNLKPQIDIVELR